MILLVWNIFLTSFFAQDNQKGSWLSEAESTEESQEITAFLKSLQGSFRPMLVSYDGSVVCGKGA